MSHPNHPPSYPAVRFLAERGDLLAIAVALVTLALGLWLAASFGWWLGLLGAAVGAVLWLILRSYVEVLRILSDTLMPR